MNPYTYLTHKKLLSCPTCKEKQPREAFGNSSSTGDGLQYECRSCSKDRRLAHRAKNKAAYVRASDRYVKRCARCRLENFAVDGFAVCRSAKDGFQSECRACHKERRSLRTPNED